MAASENQIVGAFYLYSGFGVDELDDYGEPRGCGATGWKRLHATSFREAIYNK
jgi:hypothetical protein